MTSLVNLDELDRIERGGTPKPEPPKPSDTATRAKCLLPLATIPGIVTADQKTARGG